MASHPTGTITFLFTDIAGSSSRFERQGDAMHAALARHDAILREAIERHDGYVFKRWGDAFLAAFSSASAAAASALEAQIAIRASEEAAAVGELPVRMVLHTGLAEFRDRDYYGDALNRSDRLLKIAYGGQILLSGSAADLAQPELPADSHLADLGLHRLRDLQQAVRVFELRHPSLPGGFGPLRSLEYLPTNLPQQLTSFIGREKDIAEVRSLLNTRRLLTLTGSGGCGKTRLALQVAADLMDEFPDGVWLVELAALRDEELVTRTICAALDLKEEPGQDPMDGLTAYLRSRKLLLILDNCEHLVSTAAAVTEKLLRECPALHVLATSREALAVGGETVWRVPSLSLPAVKKHAKEVPPEALETEAVRLFLDRVRSLSPGFKLTTSGAAATVEICRRLDGIPLAIELAAAMVNVLSPEQIADRLVDFFRVLSKGSRTALPRHQTLLGAIQWSYDLLTPPQQVLLRRLSVFQGGWTIEAAEDSCAFGALESTDILGILIGLVDKSLVVVEEPVGLPPRYRLLETVRQFSRHRLADAGEDQDVGSRHCDHFSALAKQGETEIRGHNQAIWLDRLEREHDNLRAAFQWAARSERAAQIAVSLHEFWFTRGHLREGRSRLESILSRNTSLPLHLLARTANALGVMKWSLCEFEAARLDFERSLGAYREEGDRRGLANSLSNIGMIARRLGDLEAAEACFAESLTLHRLIANRRGVATVLTNLANVALEKEDLARAQNLLDEALQHWNELGDSARIAITLQNAGEIQLKLSNPEGAREKFRTALSVCSRIGDKRGIHLGLLRLAHIAAGQSRCEEAAAMLGGADRIYEEMAGPEDDMIEKLRQELLNALDIGLGAIMLESCRERGHGLSQNALNELANYGGG
jgi:predicted ATPase/class 3 adenylate cyclase